MEAKELRIGNFVTIDNPEYWLELKDKIMEVVSIKDTFPLNDIDNTKYGISVNEYPENKYRFTDPEYSQFMCFIKPIPLTEECLLKFGFTKWKNKKIWSCKKVMIYFHSKDGFCYGNSNSRTYIKYVHQLQNIYHALTRTELTIKL